MDQMHKLMKTLNSFSNGVLLITTFIFVVFPTSWAMEEHCIVCAEPLQFTAYGVCQHKETCSRCVSRLRTILKDTRCAYCQQQLPCVFVTRFMGDYTSAVPPAEFDKLQVCCTY